MIEINGKEYRTLEEQVQWLTENNVAPEAYLKSASVSGKTLTLTNKDDTTVTFTDTDTTYTAGSNVSITDNVISATDTTYTAGSGISINGTTISCTVDPGSEYYAGNGINIDNNNIISVKLSDDRGPIYNLGSSGLAVRVGNGVEMGLNAAMTEIQLQADMSVVQPKLQSGVSIKTINGENILGSGNIPVGGTTYVAGSGINITGSTISNTGVLELGGKTGNIAVRGPIATQTVGSTPSLYLKYGPGLEEDVSNQLIVSYGSGLTIDSETDQLIVDQDTIQHKLTAGTGITINNNVISSTGTSGVTSIGGYTGAFDVNAPIAINAVGSTPRFFLNYGAGLTTNSNQLTIEYGTGLTIDSETDQLIVDTNTIATQTALQQGLATRLPIGAVTGTNDGTNWTSIQIWGTTMNIPSANKYRHMIVLEQDTEGDTGYLCFDILNSTSTAYSSFADVVTAASVSKCVAGGVVLDDTTYNVECIANCVAKISSNLWAYGVDTQGEMTSSQITSGTGWHLGSDTVVSI